jgi:hypothetical protein
MAKVADVAVIKVTARKKDVVRVTAAAIVIK